ncbi:MAG: hypothetical protein IPM14_14890 [bacterium]|nr:hypothetical protein [bacterium]
MFTVAWNIADGKGFTYNNDISTTGVQPLGTLLYSIPAYAIQSFGGDKYDLARAAIIFSAFLQVLFTFVIYRLALSISNAPDKGLYFLISVCVVLLNFKVLLNFANGLETGLYLVLLSIFFLCWLKQKETELNIKQILQIGILTGLLLLCRLDSLIILFTFYILLLFSKKLKVTQLVIIIIIALLIYLPWQLYVWDVTGNLMQSSARSQTALFPFFDLPYKLEQYFSSIIQHTTPFLFTGNILVWLMFPLGLAYLAVVYIYHKKYNSQIIKPETVKVVTAIAISFAVLLVIYFFFSSAPHFYFRYSAFIMVLSFPLLVVFFAKLLEKIRKYHEALLLLIIMFFAIQAYLYLHSGKSARAFSVRLEFVEHNFTSEHRIAAFQTGILGYFHDNVYNLDGKMDNEALRSFSSGGIENYIDKLNIDILMEWKDFVPVLFSKEYLDTSWKVYAEDIGDGRTICYVRKGFNN